MKAKGKIGKGMCGKQRNICGKQRKTLFWVTKGGSQINLFLSSGSRAPNSSQVTRKKRLKDDRGQSLSEKQEESSCYFFIQSKMPQNFVKPSVVME